MIATQPMFDDPSANYECLARKQLKLGNDWIFESIATAVPVGIEDQIDRLESDDELDDGARWRELEVSGAPMAWLPKGLVLITMRKRDDGEIKTKACFIQVQ